MNIDAIAKKVEGVWLPKDEQHMLHWMTKGKGAYRHQGKITYQWKKQEAAMAVCDLRSPDWKRGVFVDVGGHCGFWSMWWGEEVSRVVAFEPIDYFREIYRANMQSRTNYTLLPYGLSDKDGGFMDMKILPEDTGATRMIAAGETIENPHVRKYSAKVTTLDTMLPDYLGNDPITVLKIDCEGFEEKVVRGGEKMIRQHKPVIVVEQKFEGRHFDFEEKGAVHLLESWGWVTKRVLSGDHIMVPA